MFTILGALFGLIMDIIIIVGILAAVIALPFLFVGKILAKIGG